VSGFLDPSSSSASAWKEAEAVEGFLEEADAAEAKVASACQLKPTEEVRSFY
jgi:hypothetical protein